MLAKPPDLLRTTALTGGLKEPPKAADVVVSYFFTLFCLFLYICRDAPGFVTGK
jgi:hypothetical protein